jgi:hypothetical protein
MAKIRARHLLVSNQGFYVAAALLDALSLSPTQDLPEDLFPLPFSQ